MIGGRRTFLTGSWAWLGSRFPLMAAKASSHNPYDELGIRTVINFRGTHTTIGASKQWPELHAAMQEAARHFVSLDEVQDRVGERLSKLIGSESAMVTTGTAGAMCVGTCACVAGANMKAIRRIPDVTGLKSEVVCLKQHRNGYDHAIRNVGVKMVDVEDLAHLKNAINEKTAMMYFLGGTSGDYALPETATLEDCLKVTKAAGVPMMVDAANMLPPWGNMQKLAAAGVDLIAVSGGKHMRGPQCSGILAGRKELITAARMNMNPHSDSLGRPMKVGREEMIGVWMAAEKYAKLDFDAVDKECLKQAEYLKSSLSKIKGLQTEFTPFDRTRKVRRLAVSWDEKALGMTASECEAKLWDGAPRIAVLRHQPQGLLFTVFMNDAGDEKLAAKRMDEIFSKAR